MISVIELKKCVAGAGILGIFIGKLRYEKKPCLIILLKDDKGLEIGFYHTILLLSLAVHLQVKGNRESLLDIEEIA